MQTNSHIFIVDDIVDNIQVAMNILKEDSYQFSFASGGKQALDLIQQNSDQIDLILLDIMMPNLNGFEVCQQLKENPTTRHIPIIFLTAKVDIDSMTQGFKLGAVDYITKPFHAEELLARVKTHTTLYQSKKLLKQHNISLEIKIKYEHQRLSTELEQNQKEMIYMLSELVESTSDETGKHIHRVAEISLLLAYYHPSISFNDSEMIYHAAPMHDLGKMTVSPHILHKTGKYTEEEFEAMKKHTSNAFNLLKKSNRKLMQAAATIAHEHHEKWDGSGYPRQLKGSEIHIYGRIIALADVFDALTHTRCYKKAWTVNEAVDYIIERKGTQFDPELVDIFITHLNEFKKIVNP